ncbi:unnamed protein product [Protopolystoma xenopodis]|uniref:Uncharacterized protein n=1 Tax=Protopolystoma xenopodis TaxID=117903 RepID=A0A3S5CUK7_9PLAT|nr:unnamed protein product [Protopolystoma xenopodis]
MARLTDDADYDAGETSGNVPSSRSDDDHAYNELWTRLGQLLLSVINSPRRLLIHRLRLWALISPHLQATCCLPNLVSTTVNPNINTIFQVGRVDALDQFHGFQLASTASFGSLRSSRFASMTPPPDRLTAPPGNATAADVVVGGVLGTDRLLISQKALTCLHEAILAMITVHPEYPHFHVNEAFCKPLEALVQLGETWLF